MSSDIWTQCADHKRTNLDQTVYRSIVCKAANTTRKHVDSDAEHEVLEKLLDDSKPSYPEGPHNYIIKTPFRYRSTSRFGIDARIFYASTTEDGCFAERGYYLFRFTNASEGLVETSLRPYVTVFTVKVCDPNAVDLTSSPFANYHDQMASPTDYRYCQALGFEMKKNGVNSFLFPSARRSKDKHVGIFEIDVIRSHSPESESIYQAHVDLGNGVATFLPQGSSGIRHTFELSDCLVNGRLPVP